VPPIRHGVKLMSMGFLIEDDAPVIWRGPMIMKAIQQFVTEVEWGTWIICWWTCRRGPATPSFRSAKRSRWTAA